MTMLQLETNAILNNRSSCLQGCFIAIPTRIRSQLLDAVKVEGLSRVPLFIYIFVYSIYLLFIILCISYFITYFHHTLHFNKFLLFIFA